MGWVELSAQRRTKPGTTAADTCVAHGGANCQIGMGDTGGTIHLNCIRAGSHSEIVHERALTRAEFNRLYWSHLGIQHFTQGRRKELLDVLYKLLREVTRP